MIFSICFYFVTLYHFYFIFSHTLFFTVAILKLKFFNQLFIVCYFLEKLIGATVILLLKIILSVTHLHCFTSNFKRFINTLFIPICFNLGNPGLNNLFFYVCGIIFEFYIRSAKFVFTYFFHGLPPIYVYMSVQ